LVVTAHDVTGWAEREVEMRAELSCDRLTGLGNRAGLMVRLEQAVRSSALTGPRPAVILLDLDYFKQVNDQLGHAAGDVVLASAGARFAEAVGAKGTVFRAGGDEFVVLLDQVTEEEAAHAGEAVVASLAAPLDVAGTQVAVSVTAGIAILGENRRAESILAQADMAMYRAKSAGRGTVQFFTHELRDWSLARKTQVEKLSDQLARLQEENQALAEAVIHLGALPVRAGDGRFVGRRPHGHE